MLDEWPWRKYAELTFEHIFTGSWNMIVNRQGHMSRTVAALATLVFHGVALIQGMADVCSFKASSYSHDCLLSGSRCITDRASLPPLVDSQLGSRGI